MVDIIGKIHEVAKLITNDSLNALRLEEEMLIMLVKDAKHSQSVKVLAFDRIKECNEKQLASLGYKK